MAGLFETALPTKPAPDVPTIESDEVAREKNRQLALRLAGLGNRSTILSGGEGIPTADIQGTAATLEAEPL